MKIFYSLATAALLLLIATGDVAAQQCDCGAGGCDQRGCDNANCGAGQCNQDGVQGSVNCGAGQCSQVGTNSPSCGAGQCNQKDSTSPNCGAGYCNQIGTTDATCGAGHCQQDNAINPTCGSAWVGRCTQENATNPTCVKGDCCPPASLCSAGFADCIGAETRIFSCTLGDFVPAWEVSTGDSIRTLTSDGPVCSEVYYTFKHTSKHPAYSVKVQSPAAAEGEEEEAIVLSPHHIAYVGETFDERRAVLSKNLRVGDKLLTIASEEEGGASLLGTVVSIEMVESKLINILPFEPAIETESGVVISAHSFNEAVYSYIFWPFALAYTYLGVGAVEATTRILEKTEEFTTSPKTIMLYYLSAMLLSSAEL